MRALGAGAGGRIPTIALTAYASIEDTQKAILGGFSAHVAKPVDKAMPLQAIIKLVNHSALIKA